MNGSSPQIIKLHALGRADLIAAVVLTTVGVSITFDAWVSILRSGLHTEELSYVLLAPIVIGWVALAAAPRVMACSVRRQWGGILILILGWGMFWYGYLADPVLWRAGAVVIAVGAIVSALGLEVLVRLWPVFVATVFLIPIDPTGRYQIAMPLQVATAHATQTVCDILGIYVTRSGSMISINGMDVTVAEACNGMRMVMTLFMVCYVVAFTTPMSGLLRALLLLLSPLVAITANVVRLVPTVWMFGHKSRDAAERFHEAAGWVMIVAAFLFLVGFVRLLRWVTSPEAELRSPSNGLAKPTRAQVVQVVG